MFIFSDMENIKFFLLLHLDSVVVSTVERTAETQYLTVQIPTGCTTPTLSFFFFQGRDLMKEAHFFFFFFFFRIDTISSQIDKQRGSIGSVVAIVEESRGWVEEGSAWRSMG